MCVSADNNKTCVFSGLPLTKHTKYGIFCDELCGYKEAQIISNLNDQNRVDVLPTKPMDFSKTKSVSASADKYIDTVHAWIEAVKSKFFS